MNVYTIQLSKDEEKVAQLLTRDAWLYFSSLISQREMFHVKEIPAMPRGGIFEVVNDAEIIQYYLDGAANYSDELGLHGWDEQRIESATVSFIDKVEEATGLKRGMGFGSVGMAS